MAGGKKLSTSGPLLAVLAVGLAWGLGMDRWESRYLHALLAGRAQLDDDTVYEMYFRESGWTRDSVLRAWRGVGKVMRVDRSRLRPTDTLDWLKPPSPVFRLLTPPSRSYNLIELLEQELMVAFPKEGGPCDDLREVTTLGDVVRLCCQIEQKAGRSINLW
jgi:hypothetical protein